MPYKYLEIKMNHTITINKEYSLFKKFIKKKKGNILYYYYYYYYYYIVKMYKFLIISS